MILKDIITEGEFDYHSGCISVSNIRSSFLADVTASLTKNCEIEKKYKCISYSACLIHEYTHYIDAYCSLWGLEYTARKNLCANLKINGSNVKEEFDALKLNETEIAAHPKEVIHHKKKFKKYSTFNFFAYNSEHYGAMVKIRLNDEAGPIVDIPLTMLSLLEAHAVSNELLYRIKTSDQFPPEERRRELEKIDLELDRKLSDIELSEYMLLISLTKEFFGFIGDKALLILVSRLCWHCLNLDAVDLAYYANFVERGFVKNWKIRPLIANELRRGAQRSIVYFYIISQIRVFYEQNPSYQSFIKQGLKNDPMRIIKGFLKRYLKYKKYSSAIELKASMNIIKQNDVFSDYGIARESLINRSELNKVCFGLTDLENLRLPEFFIENDKVGHPPNRINKDMTLKFDSNIETSMMIEELYKDFGIDRPQVAEFNYYL